MKDVGWMASVKSVESEGKTVCFDGSLGGWGGGGSGCSGCEMIPSDSCSAHLQFCYFEVWGGCGNFRRWGLTGRNQLLGATAINSAMPSLPWWTKTLSSHKPRPVAADSSVAKSTCNITWGPTSIPAGGETQFTRVVLRPEARMLPMQ